MAFIKEDMEPVLQKYAGFGYTIYYLYQQGKVGLQDIENIFLKLNPEISFLYLEKVVHQIEESDLEEAYSVSSLEYSKSQCLNDYFNFDEGKITLKADVYETALNYHYTEKMLNTLSSQELSIQDKRIVGRYHDLLDQMVKDTKQAVVKTMETKELSRAR